MQADQQIHKSQPSIHLCDEFDSLETEQPVPNLETMLFNHQVDANSESVVSNTVQ